MDKPVDSAVDKTVNNVMVRLSTSAYVRLPLNLEWTIWLSPEGLVTTDADRRQRRLTILGGPPTDARSSDGPSHESTSCPRQFEQ